MSRLATVRPNLGNRPRLFSVAPWVALSWLLPTLAVFADERHAIMMVGASVAGIARIVESGVPSRLEISNEDIAAGYVDVRPAAALQVTSNSREGVAIEIRPRDATFASVEVNYGGGLAHMDGEAVHLVQRGRSAATLPLSYRFLLQPGLAAGSYAWPLEIRATAL